MRSGALIGLIVAGALGAALFSACSLGLDESKLNGSDASTPTDSPAMVDVLGVPDGSNPVQCNADPDCKPANACLTGHCDTTRHQCAYDICPAPACQAAVCDTTSKTCTVPTKYGFHAGDFHISTGNIGCGGGGGGARRCFAAIFPFVFVGTTNGVVARAVADPTDSSSPEIPVGGVPFFPNFIVASGTRVYFVGGVGGSGPDYKVPLAWIDAPTDPTLKTLTATSVFNSLQVPSIDGVYPDAAGGIYLMRYDGPKAFPVAHVVAPLKDLDTIAFFPLAGIPMNASPLAASGSRIVTFHQEAQYANLFSLETKPATGSASNAGDQDITASLGPLSGPWYLAQGDDGSLLWSGGGLELFDGGSDTLSVRLSWILADQTATTFDATKHVDVEPYSPKPGVGGDYPGPVAWIDATHALVLTAPNTNLNQTVVQVASRDPSPSIIANRRFPLVFHPSELAAAASNNFGYVLTPDAVMGANVHVFGTGCDN